MKQGEVPRNFLKKNNGTIKFFLIKRSGKYGLVMIVHISKKQLQRPQPPSLLRRSWSNFLDINFIVLKIFLRKWLKYFICCRNRSNLSRIYRNNFFQYFALCISFNSNKCSHNWWLVKWLWVGIVMYKPFFVIF